MITIKKIRLVNPNRKAPKVGRAPRSRTKKANPGTLYLLGKTAAALNPHKGAATTMPAKTKKHAARKNPVSVRPAKTYKKARTVNSYKPPARRKKNPDIAGALTQPIELLKFGLIALFGLVATRQVPQMALGVKNESWLGYLANLGTALSGAYGTSRFAGKTAGIAFGTGGGLYTVNRILSEKLTPVGKVLSMAGLGDAHASASLGRIIPGSVYPASYDAQGHLRLPPAFVDATRAALAPPAAAAAGMSGARGRMSSSRIAA